MLPHPTLDKLQTLRLTGMLKALAEQLKTPDIDSLSFVERLGLLVDRELTERDDKRLSSRLRQARLKHNACLEDIDYRSPRGLDKALILQLSSGQWLRDGLNLIINGPTGVGKTWLACALAHQACREGSAVMPSFAGLSRRHCSVSETSETFLDRFLVMIVTEVPALSVPATRGDADAAAPFACCRILRCTRGASLRASIASLIKLRLFALRVR